MKNGIHFISGLPRSGSTLLSAILRQNPAFHAGMTSPVGSLVSVLLREMSQRNETAVFIDNEQREAILRGIFENYYQAIHPRQTVFDTNRMWCAKLHVILGLFPEAKVICCVRHIPWIIDSIERLIRRNRWELSSIFDFDTGGTIYSRAEGLTSRNGMVGFACNALKQAMHSEEADRLLLVSYEELTAHPARVLEGLYDFLGLEPVRHDFENVSYEAGEFDARLGTPGLHRVARAVRPPERESLLPPDLWRRYEKESFWLDAAFNRRNVTVA